ncbi:MAG: hypothetical protein BMS9Abin28_2033 [Anaerolineae bacterium]|nr:MAG: hypothetical protein BMS9Abin28_2033 [Anaerolineae bacterium]
MRKVYWREIELSEFAASAMEAIMMGIRLARAFTGREKIVKFKEHFFGWYDATLTELVEPGDQPVSGGLVLALMDKTITIPWNNRVTLAKALSRRDVAALIVEARVP